MSVRMKSQIFNCLKFVRQEAKITQRDLAENVGVTRQTIIAMEKGSYIPSLDLALRIALVFKRPVEHIFNLDKGCPEQFV